MMGTVMGDRRMAEHQPSIAAALVAEAAGDSIRHAAPNTEVSHGL
jgi:hypothetical protein